MSGNVSMHTHTPRHIHSVYNSWNVLSNYVLLNILYAFDLQSNYMTLRGENCFYFCLQASISPTLHQPLHDFTLVLILVEQTAWGCVLFMAKGWTLILWQANQMPSLELESWIEWLRKTKQPFDHIHLGGVLLKRLS